MHVAAREIGVCLALTQAIGRSRSVGDIYAAALDALQHGLAVHRAAILLIDGAGVMRFEASRGLSEAYRRVVEGHSPWPAEAHDPDPIVVPDALADASLAPFRHALSAECIRALAFIPLVSRGTVIGKFMLYAEQPRAFDTDELQLARVIAAQVAFAVERARAEDVALEAARLKDEFLATLSHELRTPLSAIVGWVQLLQDGTPAGGARPREAIDTIGRNARLQAQLIDDILDVSRIITGKLPSTASAFPGAGRAGAERRRDRGRREGHRAPRSSHPARRRCTATRAGCSRCSATCCRTRSSSRRRAAS